MKPVYYAQLALLSCILLSGCFNKSEQHTTGMGQLLDGDIKGYSPVVPGVTLSFPEDHQAHNGFRQEWWYLTANLTTASGEQLGLQWTQFRIALAPPKTTATVEKPVTQTNSWQTQQLYMSHTAITTKTEHLAAERWSRGHDNLSGTQANPLIIQQDDWQWRSDDQHLFPATLKVTTADFNYQLKLDSQAPFQLQGDAGYSRKNASGTVASYYYSQPFIKVSGTIEHQGELIRVSGDAWLDREWSSQFLSKTQQGWDWFALRLNDGSALMLFQLRDNSGKQQDFYSAKRMYPDGSGTLISSDQISMTATAWQQTSSGRYPVAWEINIPSQAIAISTNALNDDANMPLSIPYWEGPIQISGSHSGLGYMELTGY
ncbi:MULTISPECIES: lipocalin-like domain-containing protein [Shewanella]|uniref:Carotenoid 1,2-hydratase n=1 Tax=Shewanella fidelis TaxID=173509 RepID=A0AAW8NR32_9GAMM|nr:MULTISPECIES: lipocalin-like domain-containing protein [Shewanella]MDR8525177.1 carotenoid 1,2-hydratase [Shewanella fidelis]MDW4811248.1 carotenoid 1,2-hydratase [Shewanella fidelis]MDW4814973.1 carotenoid 1,2-hydratase [Shewanella fidelis]MDW4819063.1 carotenoid 1,2-hydratase [Shewanella fidelis]MDW4823260.1 carotenoid 1,2-hydratase [Shewanella fidelis]